MSGLPTPIVTLDDGTSSFPYDVSPYLRMPDGISFTKGRGDQQSTINPSTLTFTLENIDGRFTPGDPTYGLRINQRVRFRETRGVTVFRFDGYIQTVTLSWPDGDDQFCVTTITAADFLTVLQRHLLRSVAEHEFLADAPSVFYPLAEASGATAAGDASGSSGPPLILAGAGAAPAFGTEMPGTAVATSGALFASEQYLTGAVPASPTGVEIAFQTTDAAATQVLLRVGDPSAKNWRLEIAAGTLQVVVQTGIIPGVTTVIATGVADGLTHVVFGGGASGLYLDGVAKAAGTIPALTSLSLTVGAAVNGTLALAATYSTTLSDARVAAHATAILNGFTTDSSDARIARLLGYAGITLTGTPFEAGLQTSVPPQQTAGVTALDAIQQVANAEGGLFYTDFAGLPAFQNREHRPAQTSPDWSIVAIDTDPGTAYTTDTQNFVNYATAKSVTGAEQIAQSAASIAIDGQYAQSLDLLVGTDAEVLDQASWLVNTRSIQRPKLPAVVVDLMSATLAFQQAALIINISDRINVSGMPSQTPATGDLVVEGFTETITATSWQMTFNTSAFAPYNAPVVDTAGATCDTGYPVYF